MKDINTLKHLGDICQEEMIIASGIMAYIAYSEDNNDCWAGHLSLKLEVRLLEVLSLSSFTPIGPPFILNV